MFRICFSSQDNNPQLLFLLIICELSYFIDYRCLNLGATSHKRLRARDHHTSTTLIGGKGGAGPNSFHTTL